MWVTENSTAENKTCCCNDGGGNARTYWQEDMIQSPGLFFFLPSPFQQTPDGHPAGTTISLLRFWQPLIPCSFPSLYKTKKDKFTILIPRQQSPACLKLANFQQILERVSIRLRLHMFECTYDNAVLRNLGNRWHSGISVCGATTLTAAQE